MVNLLKTAQEIDQKSIKFSGSASGELGVLMGALKEILNHLGSGLFVILFQQGQGAENGFFRQPGHVHRLVGALGDAGSASGELGVLMGALKEILSLTTRAYAEGDLALGPAAVFLP